MRPNATVRCAMRHLPSKSRQCFPDNYGYNM